MKNIQERHFASAEGYLRISYCPQDRAAKPALEASVTGQKRKPVFAYSSQNSGLKIRKEHGGKSDDALFQASHSGARMELGVKSIAGSVCFFFMQLRLGLPHPTQVREGMILLPGFALKRQKELLASLQDILAKAPPSVRLTPGGRSMGARMSGCGTWVWHTDRKGYRYVECDPQTGRKWPEMPGVFCDLAQKAALECGFFPFEPDGCLINVYDPGIGMSLHQDINEEDFSHPIVSVSLGLPTHFLVGGQKRLDSVRKVWVQHGDVIVFGGVARCLFHGVEKIGDGIHPDLGACRVNLTFRRAKRV